MPNLLKSLPKEILEKEDSKFIYNVLNPLLFDKIKETNEDTTVTHTVSALLNKDINLSGQYIPEYILPYNINYREFNVYMSDEQENIKLEYFGEKELLNDLDDLKDFIFFYFGVDGYTFLYDIIKRYYYIVTEYDKNKRLYEYNYEKYLDVVDVRKKKIYKATYEHFKQLFDEYSALKIEFDLVLTASSSYNTYSVKQLVDNYARDIGNNLGIKTFDNEIVFSESKLYSHLEEYVNYSETVTKYVFSGKNIVSSSTYTVTNVFELIAIFAMELSTLKAKYDEYLTLLVNNGNGYALERSENRRIKNEVFSNISIGLDSDNLTYFLNEEENKLDIYIYFQKDYRIYEPSFNITINGEVFSKSIQSLNGLFNRGYTIFEYFDDETKYYKITIHEYLLYDLNREVVNYNIVDINAIFTVIKAIYKKPESSTELAIETTGFLDNFVIYTKNEKSGFYEILDIPYKIKITIDDKEERYIRTFELAGIDDASHLELISQQDIIIGCYDFDYFYEPKLYVDFFKFYNNTVNFRYNTIVPYVLLEDVLDEEFELSYYELIGSNDYSTNITKNTIMYDGKTYRRLFDEINYMMLLNPYNESNYEFVSKISYNSYVDRNHVNPTIILNIIDKIPFKNNLRYLEKIQFDTERNMIIFMHKGIQQVIPLNEGLERGLNFENITYNSTTGKVNYYGKDICDEGFRYVEDGIYLKNPINDNYDLIETVPTEQLNLGICENKIFFDMYEMSHCFITGGKKYKINGLYIDTYTTALRSSSPVMFVESKYGIPRYKTQSNEIIDVNFSIEIVTNIESHNIGSILFQQEDMTLKFKYSDSEYYSMSLLELVTHNTKHRQVGMSAFSIFYAGNTLPENSNKKFIGRENIYGSLSIPDNIYNIGRSGDNYNDLQQHELLAEQLDYSALDAAKYNLEQEPYLMFKSATSSLKGLESYIKSSLKSISQKIGVSQVYLVQRNRFISEWAKVSTLLPSSQFVKEPLKGLVADLMETKLLNHNYDDLMDIFKNNEYENFSIDTNNIHSILIQYILRFFDDDYLLEDFTYYLIHEIWMKYNRKKIIDYINDNCDDQTIRIVSEMTFNTNNEKEQLFYIFVEELKTHNPIIINSYIPLSNYSDWNLYVENNDVKFDKPYSYEVIDISDFITMAVEWDQPLYMIRPLTEDGIFVKRDFRFLDISMVTNTQVTMIDSYNEYIEDIKNKLNKSINYLSETLDVLNELSISDGFDLLSINLVIIKWVVERHLPLYMASNTVEDVETFREVIKQELMSAEHPNLIVSYNKIKETTLLGDLGTNVSEIYNSITNGNMILNTTIRLNVTSSAELEYLDKIKKPLEHYFDYLFYSERYDIVAKVLALFTEDVIATSLIDLSFAINIKNTKGDETFDIYEQMIYAVLDEFLPFHTVLDKIIFTIKIMESASIEAVSKEVEAVVEDTYFLNIVMDFIEKVRIQTTDSAIFHTWMFTPSEGMLLCGGHDEIPYDYDRSVKVAGHDIPPHMDDYEIFGVDDEWYVINKERWRERVESLTVPPEYADFWWDCGMPRDEMEQVADTFINDYYHIKTEFFERDKIDSYFVDSIPTINILQGVDDNPDIDVTEDYLIRIDSTYNIKFYDMELLTHDEHGLDEAWGPSDQMSLVDVREGFTHNILHDFYEKLNIVLLDSIWTEIFVIYDFDGIPGHDEFGIDEYYHQMSPDKLEQELSTSVNDSLNEIGFEIHITDMSDISLVNESLATQIAIDYREYILDTVLTENYHIDIDIITNRHFDSEGHFIRPAHDEFAYDEYYHNSADEDRIDNMADIIFEDFMGIVKIDFGFMRMLPFDPYQELIDQRFYRANLPGSEFQRSTIRDTVIYDIHSLWKDIIRVGMMDFYMLDMIDDRLRMNIYDEVEEETTGGDWFASHMSDSLIDRHIHHDFRENIIAIDKYATILTDEDILAIYGVRAAEIERDGLFKLEIGDKYFSTIKLKPSVERSLTRFDRDYLRSIKIEEDNFVEFKYMDDLIDVRFSDVLKTYMVFAERATVILNYVERSNIQQINKEPNLSISMLDKVFYGYNHGFEIDGMEISMDDILLQAWSNKIHKDSMVISVTEVENIETLIDSEYLFGEERILQPHDLYGQMGYTDESIDRSIDSKLTDSLIQVSKESHFESIVSEIYDGFMHDVGVYFGDYIDVTLNEAIHTYIDIVKKPWIFPEFDNFGHNEYPHMYNGESDEFDITTQVREALKYDAYTNVYDSGALVVMYDRIYTGFGHDINKDEISVSMTDDLKVLDILTTEIESIKSILSDHRRYETNFSETPLNIVVSDSIWYGYKLKDDWTNIETNDVVYYYYTDEETVRTDSLPVVIRDWFKMEYTFIDDKPNIVLSDTFKKVSIEPFFTDYTSVSFKENLTTSDFLDLTLFDTAKVYMADTITINEDEFEELIEADLEVRDTLTVNLIDVLRGYGDGKKIIEELYIGLDNRLYIDDYPTVPSNPIIDVKTKEYFEHIVTIDPFIDSLQISTYERMKFGPIFKDSQNIVLSDILDIRLSWLDDRYGVDMRPHSDYEMEYYNDSSNRSVTTEIKEDIKIVDIHLDFGESLIILSSDQLVSDELGSKSVLALESKTDGIVIMSTDNLMYGIGVYDYIWDAKEWENYGYSIPYENWSGHIPHDEFPYDEMEHSDQGEDLSQVNTGVTENLLYGFDFIFKDTLSIQLSDELGFSGWGYQSVFKDNVVVYTANRIRTEWEHNRDNNDTIVNLRNEMMTVSYAFDDNIKSHKFIAYNDVISTEEISLYDETYQLLETIIKYRIYEKIDIALNTNLLNSALFKYDDDLSLMTNYKTKIDVYKTEEDGTITKSMTVIKDKTTAKIELLFMDGIMTIMKEHLHATYADKPNEYF